MSSAQDLALLIKNKFQDQTEVVIGISGFGGSGKTTLANNLVEVLDDAKSISIDGFLLRDKFYELTEDANSFDRARFEEQVLKHTHAPEINYQVYDWDKDKLITTKIRRPKYLIIEGISIWHPGLEDYYDFKIWVDESLEDSHKAGKQRPGESQNVKYWDEVWTPSDKAYYEKYRPDKLADVKYKR